MLAFPFKIRPSEKATSDVEKVIGDDNVDAIKKESVDSEDLTCSSFLYEDSIQAIAPVISTQCIENHHESPKGRGRGIREDFGRTIGTHWGQEMKNFDFKTVGVSLCLFIAVIAPSITFGAVYAKLTHNYIGAVELLLATAWCGIFYSLVGGMPMMINGGTGSVLVFQALIFEMSKQWGVPFLSLNAWVGLWVAFYMFMAAFLDLNRFIRYTTRFTDEIFAILVVSIFILDALGNPTSRVGLMHYFYPNHPHHLEAEEQSDDYEFLTVAFFSLILGFGTCFCALALRNIKNSPFCCNDLFRSAVADFAIILSVVLWTVVNEVIFPDVLTEKLNAPDTFATTFICCDASCSAYWPDDCPDLASPATQRPWFVNLMDLNGHWWLAIVAAGPAALAFILAFLDNGITWHMINHPSNKVTLAEACNYDTCVSAFMIAVNSLFGLPWLVTSTVPCMMHLSGMSEKSKDGEVLSVQQSRLTGFFTHGLVLLSLNFLWLIKLIPLPVLYGVFLFMGMIALPSQQFWQRFLLVFMQPAKYPKAPYTVFVERHRIHLYTCIQLVFFGLLYTVKTIRAIAIAFPFFILLCIPVRLYLLPRIFEDWELIVLDGSPKEVEAFLREKAHEHGDNDKEKTTSVSTEEEEEDKKQDQDGGASKSILNANDQIVEDRQSESDA